MIIIKLIIKLIKLIIISREKQKALFHTLNQILALEDSEIEQAVFTLFETFPTPSRLCVDDQTPLDDLELDLTLTPEKEEHNEVLRKLGMIATSTRVTSENCHVIMRALLHPCHLGLPAHLPILEKLITHITTSYQRCHEFTSGFCGAISNDYRYMQVYLSIVKQLAIMKEDREEISTTNAMPQHFSRILVLQLLEKFPRALLRMSQAARQTIYQLAILLLTDECHTSASSGSHIKNSEDNGRRLRVWQALVTVLRHFRKEDVTDEICELYRRRFEELCLKDVRQYMEYAALMLCKA